MCFGFHLTALLSGPESNTVVGDLAPSNGDSPDGKNFPSLP